jgi:Glycosidases
MNNNDTINKDLMFADETDNFRTPSEPEINDRVILRFRTAKNNVDIVYLCYANKRKAMKKNKSDKYFDYYIANIKVWNEIIYYYFEIVKGEEHCYYFKIGAVMDMLDMYRFSINPEFRTPEWAKGAVMYQIYVDRFFNGDITNDIVNNEYYYINSLVKKIENWDQHPSKMDVGNFYGGDLQGIVKKLDYLKWLGVEVLYLNPIFVSPSNHKYDTQDYEYIDPHYACIVDDFGITLNENDRDNKNASKYISRVVNKKNLEASNEFFASFVKAIHDRGMKLILDGVFNHCGSFNKWLDKEEIYAKDKSYEAGAYISYNSPYKDYFEFDLENQEDWPRNNSYTGWWGHNTLPKLNYNDSDILYKKILKIAEKWLLPPYCIDGWRLDVAADLGFDEETNHRFWKDFRKTVKTANPNAIIIAEHYGDAQNWLKGDQWDTIMNYDAFMEPITWFLTGMQKHSDSQNEELLKNAEAFFVAMKYENGKMQVQSLFTAMNQLSNHDHSRFLTRTNSIVGRLETLGSDAAAKNINKKIFYQAIVLQMTWIGAPTIYYGDEAGVCGWTDPDNRRTYPWGKEDILLIDFHHYMVNIRKQYRSLKKGSYIELLSEYGVIVYARFIKCEAIVVVINRNEEQRNLNIELVKLGTSKKIKINRIVHTYDGKYNIGIKSHICTDHVLNSKIEGIATKVYHVSWKNYT